MNKKIFFQISVIVLLSVLIGILYNNSTTAPLPLISERTENFSQSDSLMIAIMRQDSILRTADSLKLLSLKSEDSLRLINEQRIKDSLDRTSKLDSLKRVSDSLKTLKKDKEEADISEDDFYKGKENLDSLIGKANEEIQAAADKKQEEISTI